MIANHENPHVIFATCMQIPIHDMFLFIKIQNIFERDAKRVHCTRSSWHLKACVSHQEKIPINVAKTGLHNILLWELILGNGSYGLIIWISICLPWISLGYKCLTFFKSLWSYVSINLVLKKYYGLSPCSFHTEFGHTAKKLSVTIF